MKLDPTFLTVHPRTAAWWIEREKCRECFYHSREISGAEICGHPHCVGPGTGHGSRNSEGNKACIAAREGACGPDAKLFSPKKGKA